MTKILRRSLRSEADCDFREVCLAFGPHASASSHLLRFSPLAAV